MVVNTDATGTPKNARTPGKRLALFFDGTWNQPGAHTNVWRLYLMLADKGDDGIPQLAFYDEGVGTRWYDSVSGGAFGAGLSENVRKGYRWLMEHYQPDDEIFIFGFSRGAFTARSLAGLIARCGLLTPDAPISFTQIYDRYQKGDTVPAIYQLKYFHVQPTNLEEKILRDSNYYHRDFIKMVGVWDTVGSLGVPLGNIKGISRNTLTFHNTRLSTTTEHSYQALALDEYRHPYWAILWTYFVADEAPRGAHVGHVEQRWFAGAHADVGGGYRSDLLPQRPLAWLQDKARNCGLGFRSFVSVTDDDLDLVPHDSYSEFLRGAWKVATLGQRYIRSVRANPEHKPSVMLAGRQTTAGTIYPANERIDPSVFARWQAFPDYRPQALIDWAKRARVDLDEIAANPGQYPQFCAAVTAPGVELV